jgi:hypothetical protein
MGIKQAVSITPSKLKFMSRRNKWGCEIPQQFGHDLFIAIDN